MEDAADAKRDFMVVLGCWTPARFEEGLRVQTPEIVSEHPARVFLALRTTYLDAGHAAHLPCRLYFEASVRADSLQAAIAAAEHSANVLTPVISLACNVFVPEARLEIAYETTSGVAEREFKQWFYDDPTPTLPHLSTRLLDPHLVGAIIVALSNHPEAQRLHRAAVQYQEALRAWAPNRELRSVTHLYMAVEALTKACLRTACNDKGVDEAGLCAKWGIERKQLDGEVRRRLIFEEDSGCYRTAKECSDGLEHGFTGFQELHELAMQCRDCMALHVRSTCLSLLDLSSDDLAQARTYRYDVPTVNKSLVRSVTGYLSGEGTPSSAGMDHPYLDYERNTIEFAANGDVYSLKVNENFRAHIGADVTLTLEEHGSSIAFNEGGATLNEEAE